MSKEYVHTDFSGDSYDPTDARLDFECKQAFLRKEFEAPDVNVEWKKFRNEVNSVSVESNNEGTQKKRKTRYALWGTLSGVAAILLLLTIWRGYDAYMQQRPVMIFVAEQRGHDILIGTDNGNQQIVHTEKLTDPQSGALLEEGKADFRTTHAGVVQQKNITTPYGKDYRVVLNDGTEVIMNADSKLSFPTRFTGKERIVTLEGEAYFKVAKNPAQPFIVKTNRIDTKAIGTEFNVRAYKGTEPHVTLIEGIVEVTAPEVNKNVRISPNEDVTISDNTLHVKDIDPEYYIQWKEGFFYYDNVALGEILSDIGRWYNVNVEIEKPALMSYRLHFVLNRDAKIDEIVESLNDFSYLNAIKIGNKISIREKKALD